MATAAAIKAEDGVDVKAEMMDVDEAPRYLDDADYEDTGDLEIPNPLPNAWLARVPEFLHEKYMQTKNDEDVQIGTIRYYPATNHWKMILDPSRFKDVPSSFIMEREDNVDNTFIFSEMNMPGFKAGKKEEKKPSFGNGVIKRGARFSKFQKSVPKQTALKSRIRTTLNCVADRKQNKAYLEVKSREILDMSKGVSFLSGDPRELEESMNANSSMIFDTSGRVGNKKRSQTLKATRMPENELRDALFDAFNEYRYWSMKALRVRLQQPETYLKEVLASVADLIKAGPFAGKYQLKPEYETRVGDEVKAEAIATGDENSDSDDDIKDMEDVDDEDLGDLSD